MRSWIELGLDAWLFLMLLGEWWFGLVLYCVCHAATAASEMPRLFTASALHVPAPCAPASRGCARTRRYRDGRHRVRGGVAHADARPDQPATGGSRETPRPSQD